MLETIAVVLVILWLLGLVTSTTMGGLIHGLLVIAVVVILIRVIQGRRISQRRNSSARWHARVRYALMCSACSTAEPFISQKETT